MYQAVDVLPTEDEGTGLVVIVHCPLPSLHILVGITRAECDESRNGLEHVHVLNGLMGGAVLANANGIMGEDPARVDLHESERRMMGFM